MGEFIQHTREQLEMKVHHLVPFFVGFVNYMMISPNVMSEDEMRFRDKRASVLANFNVASTIGIPWTLYKVAEYFSQ